MNHMGDMSLAKEMIVAAKESGADYAKFQTWKCSSLKPGPWDNDGRTSIYQRSELTIEKHNELKQYCDGIGISFLTSCFNIKDLSMIRMFCSDIKIPSPECTNVDMVMSASNMFDNVFISTGAAKINEIKDYIKLDNVILLHCVSRYPCPSTCINLPRMLYIRNMAGRVGYSGHYDGIWDAIAAISLGACLIEKHFTISRDLPFRDNAYSILPDHLKQIREYADEFCRMSEDKGEDYQIEEEIIRNVYKGRWS